MTDKNKTKCAVILAAGLGERFRPLTLTLPKPAIPFLNKPMICWILDQLIDYGVEKIFINLHHLPHLVKNCIRPYFRKVEIFFSFEKNILGTYGIFYKIKKELPEKFFVINTDVFMDFPLKRADELFSESKNITSLLLLRKKRKGEQYTPFSIKENIVTKIGEGDFHFCGMYIATKKFLRFAREEKKMELSEILKEEIKQNSVGQFISESQWLDLGTPQKYLESTKVGLKKMVKEKSIIPQNSMIIIKEGFPILAHKESYIASKLGISGFIVLGKNSRLEEGTSAQNIVLLENSILRCNAKIKDAIVFGKNILYATMDKKINYG